MSVQTEIDRISTAVQNAHLKVIEKGGTSAAPYLVANLPDAIDTIPEATEPKLQAKSATPSETAQTVKPDSGYDGLSQVSVGAISKTYVGSSVPKQVAQTITPGTADKTIASGRYLTGTQTIKGDSNLKAENIKQGVSIFGVAGNYEGSGGSGGAVETCTVVLDASSSSYRPYYYSYTTVDDNGNITGAAVEANSATDVTLNNVVCGSVVTVYWYGGTGLTTTNATKIASPGTKYFNAYLITAPAGGTATIKNSSASSGGS